MSTGNLAESFREGIVDFISPSVIIGVFLLAVMVFIIVSIALMYHWKNYNVNSTVTKRVIRAYFLISSSFLFAMLVAAISYST